MTLPDVLWIGGAPGTGKTTVARALAHAHDLGLYVVDHHGYDHLRRSAAAPLTYAQRWHKPPEELLADFVATSRERFAMVLDDLRALAGGPAYVVEGPQLLPSLVAPLLPSPDRAVFLLAPPGDAARNVAARGEHVPANLPARNALLARLIADEAAALGLRTAASLDSLPPGLRGARDGTERRALRRRENAVAARQLVSYEAAEALPDAPVHAFSCECERLGCAGTETMTAGEYERRGGADAHGATLAP